MVDYEVQERDWKTFRKHIGTWQENYMEALLDQYQEIANDHTIAPSKRFWKLCDRIKKDAKLLGVIIEMSRSLMIHNLLNRYDSSAITLNDLKDFTPELQARIKEIVES